MKEIIFVCKPDKNGVYSIGGRYLNMNMYRDASALSDYATDCPVCDAYQLTPKDSKCAVCGYDISYLDARKFMIFNEENKDRIEALKKNYGREIDSNMLSELEKIIKECKAED